MNKSGILTKVTTHYTGVFKRLLAVTFAGHLTS